MECARCGMCVERPNQHVNFAAHAIFLAAANWGQILMKLSRHASAVKKYVHFRLAPRADHADDVVQDIFLAAWENLRAYRGNSSLRSWLMGIARNKVKDYYRASLREPQPLETANESF